jgi:hypothetical protein
MQQQMLLLSQQQQMLQQMHQITGKRQAADENQSQMENLQKIQS